MYKEKLSKLHKSLFHEKRTLKKIQRKLSLSGGEDLELLKQFYRKNYEIERLRLKINSINAQIQGSQESYILIYRIKSTAYSENFKNPDKINDFLNSVIVEKKASPVCVVDSKMKVHEIKKEKGQYKVVV